MCNKTLKLNSENRKKKRKKRKKSFLGLATSTFNKIFMKKLKMATGSWGLNISVHFSTANSNVQTKFNKVLSTQNRAKPELSF